MTALSAAALVLGLVAPAQADAWHEPWIEELLPEATSLVELEVVGSAGQVKVVKTHAGAALSGTRTVGGTYAAGGRLPGVLTTPGSRTVCLVKEGSDGTLSVPTPFSGCATERDGAWMGAVRHSYHLGLFEKGQYVEVLGALFAASHGGTVAPATVDGWVQQWLVEAAPGALERSPTSPASKRFFAQHLVLEALRQLGRPAHTPAVLRFTRDPGWHTRASAARALGGTGGPEAVAELARLVREDDSDWVRALAAQALSRCVGPGDRAMVQALRGSVPDAKPEFGGRLMDPRVGTQAPTVYGGLDAALEAAGG